MVKEIPEQSLRIINGIFQEYAVTMIDYELRGHDKRIILDIFIDSPMGVTLDVCGSVTRQLNEASNHDKFLSDVYTLEVSSPGVDRPLLYAWQYAKHRGRILNVTLRNGTTIAGTLLHTDENTLQLDPPPKRTSPRSTRNSSTSTQPRSTPSLESVVQRTEIPFLEVVSSIVEVVFK